MQKKTTSLMVGSATGLALLAASAAFAGGADIGPSSSAAPYLLATEPSGSTTAVLTVGDTAANGYRMAGIPDGMGAFDNGDGTFTLLMNHELAADKGIVRAHGSAGAFVSRWRIDSRSLRVLSGSDQIQRVFAGDPVTGEFTPTTTTFTRFCSADLADRSAFAGHWRRLGTRERIFLNGEEAGPEGRAVAHVATGPDAGSSYLLPWLGRASWENLVAKPRSGAQTVVVGMDDSTGGQVYVYVGAKQRRGNDVQRAGLTGGKLYGLSIDGVDAESDATETPAGGLPFRLVEIPGAAAMTGAELEAASTALGISRLARPEDGSWDPSDPAGFYFATTAGFTGRTHLWRLDFSDPRDVLAGGSAAIVVAGPAYDATLSSAAQAGPRMMDNVTVNRLGQVLVQEDPGGQDYVSGVFRYDPRTGAMERVAQHSNATFLPGSPGFLTNDEESSGIFPVPFLGRNRYLAVVQAHYATGDAETVEGGQLLLLTLARGSGRADD